MAGGAIASPGHPYQVDDGVLESPESTSVPSSSVDPSPTVLIIITREAVRRQAPAPIWIGPIIHSPRVLRCAISTAWS